VAAERISRASGVKTAQDPNAQMALARARSTLSELKFILQRNIADITDAAKTGREISIETRVAYRFDSAQVVDRVSAVVDELFLCMGGSAIFTSNPIQGFFLDIHTARGHYANNPERPSINYGGVLLEQRTTDYFL
jgi:3-hydroxy-9,10-secoandrosta-1,3,5(10)-triene-9,17-dione monooxygenase